MRRYDGRGWEAMRSIRGCPSSRPSRIAWALAALATLSAALIVPPAGALGRGGWNEIQRFRDCIAERGLEAWSPWVLHRAAHHIDNPTIVRLLLQAGADPNAPTTVGGRHFTSGHATPIRWLCPTFWTLARISTPGTTMVTRRSIGQPQSGNGRVIKVLLERRVGARDPRGRPGVNRQLSGKEIG